MPPIYEVKYSNDGAWIACSVVEGLKDQHIMVIRRDDPSDTFSFNLGKDSRERAPSWAPDDKRIAFQSDAEGVNKIVIQDFQNGDKITLDLGGDEEVFGSEPAWKPDGQEVYYTVSKHSRTRVYRHSLDGEIYEPLLLPEGKVDSIKINHDGEKLVFLHSSMRSPPGIYLHKIKTESVKLLTPSNYSVDPSQLVEPQSIWYDSFDGRSIHGWYLPSASGPTPSPAIVYPHGGPTGQIFDEWMQGAFFQAYAHSGYSVLTPNFRGSTGYGVEFRDLNIGDLGGGDLEDVVAGARWLRDKDEIDGSRIAIIGASYGGFMTLMALSKRSEEFATGVSMLPVVNWLGMYELSDSSFRKIMDRLHGGPPEEREEVYRECSPITHITKIKAPVMLVAGKNDSRCPIEPIERLVDKLEEMGHSHEFIIEEKAGHVTDFVKSDKRILTHSRVVKYLNKILNKSNHD
ncbi:MAG: alpha/beta fold hydrolase [Candidatus Bathyarchaeia archaeon]